MRRIAYVCMITVALLGFSLTPEAYAGGGMHGGGGGMHGGAAGGRVHEMHGGGFRGGGGRGHDFHGGGHFDGHHHHGHYGGAFIVGVGPYWDPWGYPYPYPPSETVVVEQPQEYIYEVPSNSGTWYLCRDTGQYYPYVKECPGGWESVIPQP